MKECDVIIIGSGSSGMTAAIYLLRANLKVLIIEKNAPGGQVNLTNEIDNYPGFNSIPGPELAANMFMQMNELKPDLVLEEVVSINNADQLIKEVVTTNNVYQTKKIIIATGRKPRSLGLPGETQLLGNGISWCAICDGPLYKDKAVAVLGAGNAAFEEALYLSTLASKVYLIHRSEKFRADAVLYDKLKAKPNVTFMLNTEVTNYLITDNRLSGLLLINKINDESQSININGLFMFIGYEANSNLYENLNIANSEGYIEVNAQMETKIKGIFASGDTIKKEVYQIVTAVSEGAIAATTIVNQISSE